MKKCLNCGNVIPDKGDCPICGNDENFEVVREPAKVKEVKPKEKKGK